MTLTPDHISHLELAISRALEHAALLINTVANTVIAFETHHFAVFPCREIMQHIESSRQYRASMVTLHGTDMPLPGMMMVVFSSERAAKLALMLLSDDSSGTDMDAMRNGVFLEAGNIILNALVEHIEGSVNAAKTVPLPLPVYSEVISDELMAFCTALDDYTMVSAELTCKVEEISIQGRLMLIFSSARLPHIIHNIPALQSSSTTLY
jgi:chemotaxis protein CheY-P-specific phosphatase CheC